MLPVLETSIAIPPVPVHAHHTWHMDYSSQCMGVYRYPVRGHPSMHNIIAKDRYLGSMLLVGTPVHGVHMYWYCTRLGIAGIE